jgi:hypothetical protein
MSTVGQQRAAIQSLANRLTYSNLKRALAGLRQSEGEHIIQMLHDAVQTLNSVPEKRVPKQETPSW